VSTENAGPDSSPRSVRVYRSALAREIHDREPAGLIPQVLGVSDGETVKVFFFTELGGVPGETVLHRWELNDQTVAEVPFRIGNGTRWRVYSSKEIDSGGVGSWRAVVIDSLGNEIDARSFDVRIE